MKQNTVTISENRYQELLNAELTLKSIQTGAPAPIGFNTAKPVAKAEKPEVVVSAELRAKVAAQLEKDMAVAAAKGPRTYAGGKYYFNGFTATKVGYAAISAGGLNADNMKPATVIAIAKDYGIK